ncbi:MAG TPA: S8 family serine peptidase, partial [Candidatus Binatus sp.]|nr:S8 family serine peptidase [Candidatus Binatus sp.]
MLGIPTRRWTVKGAVKFAILSFVLLVNFGAMLGAASARPQHVTRIISFSPLTEQDDRVAAVRAVGGRVTHQYGMINAVLAEIPIGGLEELRRNPNISSVNEDVQVKASDLSVDLQILAGQAWKIGANGTGVRLAVLDTGISTSNVEFNGRIVGCHTEVPGTLNCEDDNGHGTHVAGIAGSAGVNNASRGVAPSVSFLIDKILDSNGSGQISQIIAGIEWAVNNGAKIISMSLSTQPADNAGTLSNCDTSFPSLATAVNKAVADGLTVVTAAG